MKICHTSFLLKSTLLFVNLGIKWAEFVQLCWRQDEQKQRYVCAFPCSIVLLRLSETFHAISLQIYTKSATARSGFASRAQSAAAKWAQQGKK